MPAPPDPGAYPLDDDQVARFHQDGWLHLPGFVGGAELDALEALYQRFLHREIPVEGRDFCDMSADYQAPLESFAILNVMLPGRYYPALRGNVYERRAAAVAERLVGPDLQFDYDQLVAKPPGRADAVFHWHQDLAYWPATTDTRTASFWLALDDVGPDNGGVHFVEGSHREARLRRHGPLHGDRDVSHVLVGEVDPARDRVVPAVLRRGDATVHHERMLHGSPGNASARWRRGWVVALRARTAVEAERAMGFTHSHNDPLEVLEAVSFRRPE
ncbi:MAG TPA: phytanoyl-CoA dioxygenase family protein [Planctomycetota bacterium]